MLLLLALDLGNYFVLCNSCCAVLLVKQSLICFAYEARLAL